MWSEFPYVLIITGIALTGFHLANISFDTGMRHWVSRKIGHLSGAVAYLLMALLFTTCAWPVIISSVFTVGLWVTKYQYPHLIRGIGGSARASLSEVAYPFAGVIVFAFGWGVFDKPLVCAACLCMMGAGDAITGIVRSYFCCKPEKHWSGSIAMFGVCVVFGWAFIQPMWIGVVGACVATITEWACGDAGVIKFIDDNFAIPVMSAITVFLLLSI